MLSRRPSGRCSCGSKLLTSSAVILASVARPINAQQAQPSPCLRWAHSSTLGVSATNNSALSTIYLYGGDAKTSTSQTTNTRTNALIALDVSKSWSIANPPLAVVEADNGNSYFPPQTSLGAMWSTTKGQSLFYYGGYYSETPHVDPDPLSLFRYDVTAGGSWSKVNTKGDNVVRAAEGAAAVIPAQRGLSDLSWFYFGGHEDSYTVAGWSNQTPRVYLNSMIEYDRASATWTNHSSYTSSGKATSNSTIETSPLLRADNTLTFVPGIGTDGQGVLVSIGGGNANQLLDNTILDVYDIGAGGWVRQATQGDILTPRVSHCAVRGSAKVNGQLQHQIFVYGGQASNRTTQILDGQNSEMYVLSLPSFTWTFISRNLPSQPTGRAAHTCTLIGSQMVIVGGYISEDVICEQPGVYVFDTTALAWSTKFDVGSVYTTPNSPVIINIAGGRGSGTSTSGTGYAVGTGLNDTDTSASFGDNGSRDSSNGTRTGAIVGGVVGGVLGALMIAATIWYGLRKRSQKRQALEGEKTGMIGNGDSPQSVVSDPLETQGPYSAADDVEEATQGYAAQFSHLVPRRTLRVVNA